MNVTRRTVLAGATAVFGAGLLGFSGIHVVSRRKVRGWAARLGGIPLARDLGVEYLYRYPDESSETAVIAALDPTTRLSPTLATAADSDALRHRLRVDFSGRDLVSMGGWRLARTELRLCALAALNWAAEHGASGVFVPVALADGTSVFWTSPHARLTVRPTAAGWTIRLRSGRETGQSVTLRVNGVVVDERTVTPGVWHRLHFLARRSDGPTLDVQVSATPEWRPVGDFRTVGVGLDTLGDMV